VHDLMGVGFFLWMSGLTGLIVIARGKPEKSVQRRIWLFSAWVVAGTSFVTVGILGARFNRNAAHLHGVGTMVDFHAGKNACDHFVIRMDPPLKKELSTLRCYEVFAKGTRVDVIYQEGSDAVLETMDLDGDHVGRHLTESSSLGPYELSLVLGYALLGIGLVHLLISTAYAMWRSRQLPG
jgi:hypothetical protein